MITDEYFRERAAAERASAAGIRPLAHHVRALYVEIRTLREDGVGFKYIASVLIDARGQASCDPIDVTEKLRVYHHRDRKTLGDAVPALKPGLSVISCVAGDCILRRHGSDEALAEDYSELRLGHGPFTWRHFPLFL